MPPIVELSVTLMLTASVGMLRIWSNYVSWTTSQKLRGTLYLRSRFLLNCIATFFNWGRVPCDGNSLLRRFGIELVDAGLRAAFGRRRRPAVRPAPRFKRLSIWPKCRSIKAVARQSELQYSGQRVYLGLEKTEFTEDSTKPEKEVKKYPKLTSDKPLYGTVRFGSDPLHPKEGVDYHFVLDASEPGKYDRLYFDADNDLDLTNDPPIKAGSDKWPEGLWNRQDEKENRFHFEELSVPLNFGPDLGTRPVKMLPLLFVQEGKTATLMFVSMTLSRRARQDRRP